MTNYNNQELYARREIDRILREELPDEGVNVDLIELRIISNFSVLPSMPRKHLLRYVSLGYFVINNGIITRTSYVLPKLLEPIKRCVNVVSSKGG